MRQALFALPAIAIGMLTVGYFWVGVALLIVASSGWLVAGLRSWLRRTRRVDETASGVVEKGEDAALDLLLSALPRAGARWVRVAQSHPRIVRAGTALGTDVSADEIEVVLEPVSTAATRVRLLCRAAPRSKVAVATRRRSIATELSREIGIEPRATA